MSRLMMIVCGLLLLCSTGRVHAMEDESGLKYVAVQNRLYSPTHEFTTWVGTLPLDAFVKGLTFTAAYTVHFSDLWAWEIGQFTYSLGMDTGLKDELANLPQPVGPTPFETTQYYVTSSLLFKPVYGKLAVLNRSIIHGELYLQAGAGYGWLTITGRPVVTAGAGLRLYAGNYLSFRFDLRDYLFFNLEDFHNELWIALGISLSFR